MSNQLTQIQSVYDLGLLWGSIASAPLKESRDTFSQESVTHILKVCDALWLHSGDPKAPHAELTSGKCSDGFVDTLRALRFPNLCDILAYHLARVIDDKIDELDLASSEVGNPTIGWVVGSDHAGAVFSQNVARWVGAEHDFTEKGPDGTQVWKRFTIPENRNVLQVEELMTTAKTLNAVRAGIRKGNSNPVTFLPMVATLVHRSDVYEIEGAPVVYLVHYDIHVWEPSECPLCAGGSERIKPKANWARLTGRA